MGKPNKDFAERLVHEVKIRPMLYDTSISDYKDREKVEREWANIARVFGTTADIVKKKWQNLRGSFSKCLSARLMPRGSEAGKRHYRFYLYKEMLFLANHMAYGSMTTGTSVSSSLTDPNISSVLEGVVDYSSIMTDAAVSSSLSNPNTSSVLESVGKYEEVYDEFQNPSPASSVCSSSSRKRKGSTPLCDVESILEYLERKKDKLDPVMAFFKGLAPQVNELSKSRLRQFMRNTTADLFRLLAEQEEEEEHDNETETI